MPGQLFQQAGQLSEPGRSLSEPDLILRMDEVCNLFDAVAEISVLVGAGRAVELEEGIGDSILGELRVDRLDRRLETVEGLPVLRVVDRARQSPERLLRLALRLEHLAAQLRGAAGQRP